MLRLMEAAMVAGLNFEWDAERGFFANEGFNVTCTRDGYDVTDTICSRYGVNAIRFESADGVVAYLMGK